MKIVVLILSGMLAFAGTVAQADEATEKAIIKLIMDSNAYANKNLEGMEDTVSKEGSLEFWSSGGLLQEVSPDIPPQKFESVTIKAKHITVITLVPGEIAVAQYYSEGGIAPVGSPAVGNYLTRATEVYVNEGGKWKVRAAHWSPIKGGGGISQTSVDD